MRRLALLTASLFMLALPALAATAPAPAPAATTPEKTFVSPSDVGKLIDPNTLPSLRNIVQPGVQIHYMGDEYGLKAYFVSNSAQGQGQVIYVSPDGQANLVGTLLSGDGTPITVMQLARLKQFGFDPLPFVEGNANPAAAAAAAQPKPAPANPDSPGEKLMSEASNLSWIAFGPPTGAMVTVFMDPNCDHCHTLFKTLLPYTTQGKVYLRVIPVSVVNPEKSRADVMSILGSADPAKAWAAQVNGQAPAFVPANSRTEAALTSNNTTFGRWQLGVTPYSLYRNKATGELRVLSGQPENLPAFLAELGVAP